MELNATVFWRRLRSVASVWRSQREVEGSVWHGVDAVVVATGKVNKEEGVAYLSESTHRFLFEGLIVTNTVLALCEKRAVVLTGAKKAKLMRKLAADKPEDCEFDLEVVELPKEKYEEELGKALSAVKESFDGKRVATLSKEVPVGSFAETWATMIKGAEGLELVDLAVGLQAVLMVNDPAAVGKSTMAAALVTRAMTKVFVKTMQTVFEEEKETTNKEVAKRIEDHVTNPAKMKLKNFDAEEVDLPVPPVVQSGGRYDLKLGAVADDKPLKSDVLLCQIGAQYSDYSCVVGRTFFVDPTPTQEASYRALVKAHDKLVSLLVPGAELGEVYDAVKASVAESNKDLADLLPRSMGCGTGLNLRFAPFSIRSGNKQRVQAGMLFVLSVSLADVPLADAEKSKKESLGDGKYSCVISNTVLVNAKDKPTVLTGKIKYEYDEVYYKLNDDEDEDDEDDDDDEDSVTARDAVIAEKVQNSRTRVTRSQTKTPEQLAQEKEAASMEARIAEHQEELMKKKAKRALRENAGEAAEAEENEEDEENVEVVDVYKRGSKEYPTDLIRNQMYCDKSKEAVLLPIGGFHVPFHISTIKSVSKSEEDRATLLRFAFYYPTGGLTFARDVPNSMRAVMTRFPQLNYVKEMTFRSKDPRNLNHQYRLIKEMQKRVRARQKMIEQEADLVEQVDLVLSQDRRRPPQLDDVSMRPTLKKGKCVGRLQAHPNGFRFRANTRETFDLIYTNIKHFFFQECKKELTVLIHFHLKHPVMVGRTKTYDVQFYTEVVEGSSALDGRRRNIHDPDEEEEERREQILKSKLNKMFKRFCNEVVTLAREKEQPLGVDGDYDLPYRRMAFQGVPHKEMVWLMPTVHCLVNLTETPFFVVTLDDIEHIHFERVSNGTKNFDMVIILKTQMKPNSSTPQRITSIPIESLETIRQWLHDKGDITFTAGTTPLNWKAVMEGVYEEIDKGTFWKNRDLEDEPKDVGWNFLKLEDDAEEDDSNAGSEESEFGASDQESSEGEEDDWDVDDIDESSDEPDSEEEEGVGWDELDRQAAEADKRKSARNGEDADDDDRRKRRKKNR